jgi:hypothetical protein
MAELTSLTETGVVHIDDFREFCRTHQVLLRQVFHMQSRMRQAVLGDKFWKQVATRRIELRKGYNVPISNLMVLVSNDMYHRAPLFSQTHPSFSYIRCRSTPTARCSRAFWRTARSCASPAR